MRERRTEVRARLQRLANDHIQVQLNRIEAELKERGYTIPDTAPNEERDLGWLFRKVRFKETYQAIYERLRPPPGGGVDTVRKAVLRIAARVGVDPGGWEPGWR